MTIDEFKSRRNIKENKKTILVWLNKKYIKGARLNKNTGEWFIPEEACPPYIEKKKFSSNSIYKVIAKATLIDRIIVSDYCNFSNYKLKLYYNDMVNSGYIEKYKRHGIIYYRITNKTHTILKIRNSEIFKLVKELIGISKNKN